MKKGFQPNLVMENNFRLDKLTENFLANVVG